MQSRTIYYLARLCHRVHNFEGDTPCLGVRRFRTQNPLTTPGDAINSFISEPDTYTMGMSIISQGEIRMSYLCGAPQPGPRKYRQRNRKLGTTVPWSEWLFLVAIMVFTMVGAVL